MESTPVSTGNSMLHRRFLALHDEISTIEQTLASEHEAISDVLAQIKMVATQLSIPVPLACDPLPRLNDSKTCNSRPRLNDSKACDSRPRSSGTKACNLLFRSNGTKARDAVSRTMATAVRGRLYNPPAAKDRGDPSLEPWKRKVKKAITYFDGALSAQRRRVTIHDPHAGRCKCVPIRRTCLPSTSQGAVIGAREHVASQKRVSTSVEGSATPRAATLSSSPPSVARHDSAPILARGKRQPSGGWDGISAVAPRAMQVRPTPKAARCLSPSSPSSSSTSSSLPWRAKKRARDDALSSDNGRPLRFSAAKRVDAGTAVQDARMTPHATLRSETGATKQYDANNNGPPSRAAEHGDLFNFASARKISTQVAEPPSSSSCPPCFVAAPRASVDCSHSSVHSMSEIEVRHSASDTESHSDVSTTNGAPKTRSLSDVSTSLGAPKTRSLSDVSTSLGAANTWSVSDVSVRSRMPHPRSVSDVAAHNHVPHAHRVFHGAALHASPGTQGSHGVAARNTVPNTQGAFEGGAQNGVYTTTIVSEATRREPVPKYRPQINMKRFELFRAFHQYTCADWAHRFMKNVDEPHTCDMAQPQKRHGHEPDRQRLPIPEALKALATPTSAAGLKKRCQPHWMLDRSSLVFITGIMKKYALRRDVRGLLRNLFFATVAMCKDENWVIFGEVDESRDMVDLAEKLSTLKTKKKPYDTNRSLAAFARKYAEPAIASLRQKYSLPISYDGVLCFMHNLGVQLDKFAKSCFFDPTPEKTERLLNELHVPSFAKLVLHRYLGFLSPKCSGPSQELIVGSGALPALEWIYGGEWDWPTYKYNAYKTKISTKLRKELLQDLYSRMTQNAHELPSCLPPWLPIDAQVIEHQLCELRKFATAEKTGGVVYRPRCNSCYRSLLTSAEDFFQHRAEYLDAMLAQLRTSENAALGSEEDVAISAHEDSDEQCSDLSQLEDI